MPQVSILIADNNDSFANLLQESLSINKDMHIVGVARDGIQTMKMLEETCPDVLLLDIVMPGADGLEVLRRMKSLSYKPLTMIISALANERVVNEALQLGADYYFIKPLNTQTIITKIKEYCTVGH